jgi:hypothetical protein
MNRSKPTLTAQTRGCATGRDLFMVMHAGVVASGNNTVFGPRPYSGNLLAPFSDAAMTPTSAIGLIKIAM